MVIGAALPETSLVLDNDIFTHWRNGREYVLREIASYMARLKMPPALASFTIFEAQYGIEDSLVKKRISEDQAGKYRTRIKVLSNESIVLDFNQSAAEISAHLFPRLFPRLSKKDRKAPWKDLFIAATALAHGYGVATQNRQDFDLIASLLPNGQILRLATWKP
jgi:predicted nucleic acid-binding protein